jgi:hypothetical protein
MTFSAYERDKIRSFFGFDYLYIAANPFFEQALTTIQPISEGGSAPDSSIENSVRDIMNQLLAIDGYISGILQQVTNLAVYEVPTALTNGATLKQDYAMALRTLRKNGTSLIQQIATRLGLQPIRPYFYSDGLGDSNAYNLPKFFGGRSSR